MSQSQQLILKQQEKIQNLNAKIQNLENEKQGILESSQKQNKLEKKLTKTQNKLKDITSQCNKLRTDLKEAKDNLTKTKAKPESKEIELKKWSLNEHKEEIKKLQSKLEKIYQKKKQLQIEQQKENLDEKIEQLQNNLKDFDSKCDSLENQILANNKKIENSILKKNNNQIQNLLTEKYNYICLKTKINHENDLLKKKGVTQTDHSSQEKLSSLRIQLKQKIEEQNKLLHQLFRLKTSTVSEDMITTAEEFTENLVDISEIDFSEFSENDLEESDSEAKHKHYQRVTASPFSKNLLSRTSSLKPPKSPDFQSENTKSENLSENEKSSPEKPTLEKNDIQEEKLNEIDNLQKLFKVPIAIDYFKEYLIQQLNQENLLFYLEVSEFEKLKNDKDKMEKIGKHIFEKYVKPGSLFEINIESKTRKTIITSVKNGSFNPNLFQEAKQTVFQHMDHDNFGPFKQSQIYSELITKMSAGATYEIFSPIKAATILSKTKDETFLNYGSKFKSKARHPNLVSEKLMEHVIDLCDCFYSEVAENLDCELVSSSIPFKRFCMETTELQKVRLNGLTREQQLSFFINIYNVLTFHSVILNGAPVDKSSKTQFTSQNKYNIGGYSFSLKDIKYGILRGNKIKKSRGESKYFKSNDKRSAIAISLVEPRFYFALTTLNMYSSPLRVFYPNWFERELQSITQYQALKHVFVSEKNKRISVSPVFEELAFDYGKNQTQLILWLTGYLPQKISDLILNSPNSFSLKFSGEPTIPVFLFDGKYSSSPEKNN
ncbi:electron carrier/ protein disulfide oxidoreductase [Anaeramoeba ignava]|uniref:Electron carrier/ protein disulfide oxidoreductase n=1 Tax=Anaeramoeba ignava TaxID=1746090 RepID=A0A9Q0LB21_ANAIG|nr:electron carrier/ protein disulfide oxidoreductase [Anaeramoeba ignava]|eukprot:Anaeramoba_ignava/a347464_66.p1 GENE.a347464_66~~a347464_66.p1  ORF type:complete len:774 (+),score=299.44 a347464_66:289-2610(+)